MRYRMRKRTPLIAFATCVATLSSIEVPIAQAKQKCSAAKPSNQHGYWSWRLIACRRRTHDLRFKGQRDRDVVRRILSNLMNAAEHKVPVRNPDGRAAAHQAKGPVRISGQCEHLLAIFLKNLLDIP